MDARAVSRKAGTQDFVLRNDAIDRGFKLGRLEIAAKAEAHGDVPGGGPFAGMEADVYLSRRCGHVEERSNGID
jgi:hypothetical protein